MHKSLWLNISKAVSGYPPLAADVETEIAVVGAGITGASAALELRRLGYNVVVIEAWQVGESTTGFSTGNLYVPVQPYFSEISAKFDDDTARVVAQSRLAAIDWIERTAADLGIDCSFHRRPWALLATEDAHQEKLDNEADALARAGLTVRKDGVDAPIPAKNAVAVDHQARFNPLAFVQGIFSHLEENGVRVFEHTPATEIVEYDQYCLVQTSGGSVKAKTVISATHIPKGISALHMVAAPYRSYVVGVTLRSGVYPDGNFWDLDEPHHTISSHPMGENGLEVLLIAGNHHKTGQPESGNHEQYYAGLEEFARKHFDIRDVVLRWSAQHYHSGDGLPYIGPRKSGSRILYATGFFADGLVYGALSGRVFAEIARGNDRPYDGIYDPSRYTMLKSAAKFIKENVNVAVQYLKDIPGGVEASDYGEIGVGEGKTIEADGEKLGAYRDEDGMLHIVSAVCTHMGCVLDFNNAEKSWDCPCHGSRFTVDGEIIEGPALSPLSRKTYAAPARTR